MKNYIIKEIIDETPGSKVFRGFNNTDSTPVIIKQLKNYGLSPLQKARFKKEYTLLNAISAPGIIKTYDFIEDNDNFYIIMEDISGISLKKIIQAGDTGLSFFFTVAAECAAALSEIHKRDIIHKDIKPGNIIVNRETLSVRIVDFGLSEMLKQLQDNSLDHGFIHGTLMYISPEQTGRINRDIDYRSDLYSFGVTLYELIAGRPPFKEGSPGELVYSHIARVPAPPDTINPDVPPAVSEIIMKLLSKDPDDRYQNPDILAADLSHCRESFKKTGTTAVFTLARNDYCTKFSIPRKLLGRKSEIALFESAYNSCKNKKPLLIMVSGMPGTGKTRLIAEVQKKSGMGRRYFCKGKFEQYQRDIPYSAVIQAMRSLLQQIISEDAGSLRQWKILISDALGPNGRIITDIIPEVEFIIGAQPIPPETGPEESQNRFTMVFKRFISLFAGGNKPLTLFFDDLQWADIASLKLLESLLIKNLMTDCLIIGSYRDNEVPDTHPLAMTLKRLKDEQVEIKEIFLKDFNEQETAEYVNEFFHTIDSSAAELISLIYARTNGNPFFMGRFLQTIYEKRLLFHDMSRGWYWDISAIKKIDVTDNVVDLMISGINSLSPETKEFLMTAACFGNRFSEEDLSAVTGFIPEKILSALDSACAEGYIEASENRYAFQHDKIQEAFYSLISPPEKARLHLKISRYLYEQHPDNKDVLKVTDHLNKSISLLYDAWDREQAAVLNLSAAEKCRTSAAYAAATRYINTALQLLAHDSWSSNYELSLAVYTEASEIAYLTGDYTALHKHTGEVISHAKTPLETERAYASIIHAERARSNYSAAITAGLELLNRLGFHVPRKPGRPRLLWEIVKLRFSLARFSIEQLHNLPVCQDPVIAAVCKIYISMGTTAYYSEPDLVPLVVVRSISLALRHGNTSEHAYGYLAFGMILLAGLKDIEKGYIFGELGIGLIDRVNAGIHRPRIYALFNYIIKHWKDHLSESVPITLKGYEAGLETGDLENLSLCLQQHNVNSFLCGHDLLKLEEEISLHNKIISENKQFFLVETNNIIWQTVLNLLGRENAPGTLHGRIVSADRDYPAWVKNSSLYTLCYYYLMSSLLCLLFDNPGKALSHTLSCNSIISSNLGTPVQRFRLYYETISRCLIHNELNFINKISNMRAIKSGLREIKKWMRHCPENNSHYAAIIRALLAVIKGRAAEAELLFDEAITLCRKNRYLIEEAWFNELAASYFFGRGRNKIAENYIMESCSLYQKWGAAAKVRHITNRYAGIFQKEKINPINDTHHKSSSLSGSSSAAGIDLAAIIRMSQALSLETNLTSLLANIISLSIENAGATRGYLIMRRSGTEEMSIQAYAEVNKPAEALQNIPFENTDLVPRSIINFTFITSKEVVITDITSDEQFSADPCFQIRATRSVLSIPVLCQGRKTGVLYFENDLTANAFTRERIQVLRILATHAAISIENFYLMDSEKKKAVFEKEIELAREIQETLLPRDIPSIPDAQIGYRYVPMMGVGGDFVDILHDSDTNTVGLFICDVAGHGVPAAILSSMTKMALYDWKKDIRTPSVTIERIRSMLNTNIGSMFITAALCCIELDSGVLTYANAGHPPLALIRDGEPVDLIYARGRAINICWNTDIVEKKIYLKKNDLVLLYTDGVTEAENPRGIDIGGSDEAYKKWIADIAKPEITPEDFCSSLYSRVIDHRGVETLDDDFTVLAFRYTPH